MLQATSVPTHQSAVNSLTCVLSPLCRRADAVITRFLWHLRSNIRRHMSSDTYERVNFLSQAAEYLSVCGERGEARLGCYYQHTGREIRLKNQVSCFGWDSLKRNCCKTCLISLNHSKTASLKTRNGSLVFKCLNCNSSRKRFRVQTQRKTYYENLLFGKQVRPHHDAGPEDKDSKAPEPGESATETK